MNSSILLYNMNSNVQYSKKAIELRRLGFSYTDISTELREFVIKESFENGLSVSAWLEYIIEREQRLAPYRGKK